MSHLFSAYVALDCKVCVRAVSTGGCVLCFFFWFHVDLLQGSTNAGLTGREYAKLLRAVCSDFPVVWHTLYLYIPLVLVEVVVVVVVVVVVHQKNLADGLH